MKKAEIERFVEQIESDKEFKIKEVRYQAKAGEAGDDPEIESVEFLFESTDKVKQFVAFVRDAKNDISDTDTTSYEQIVSTSDNSAKISADYLKMLADHKKYIPLKFRQIIMLFREELNEGEEPAIKQVLPEGQRAEFQNTIKQIQTNFKQEMEGLKHYLDVEKVPPSKVKALIDDINKVEEELFKKLKIYSSKAEVISALEKYITDSCTVLSKHEKIMDHSLPFKFVETIVKAVTMLFVGIGMVFGSLLKRGLASSEDRKWYKDTFLTFHKSNASKAVSDLKKQHGSYQDELDQHKPQKDGKPSEHKEKSVSEESKHEEGPGDEDEAGSKSQLGGPGLGGGGEEAH